MRSDHMGRNAIHKNRDKNKQKLPQVPDQYKREADGVYEEYSAELADQDDREAACRQLISARKSGSQNNNRGPGFDVPGLIL